MINNWGFVSSDLIGCTPSAPHLPHLTCVFWKSRTDCQPTSRCCQSHDPPDRMSRENHPGLVISRSWPSNKASRLETTAHGRSHGRISQRHSDKIGASRASTQDRTSSAVALPLHGNDAQGPQNAIEQGRLVGRFLAPHCGALTEIE